jgi:hypothetical protein
MGKYSSVNKLECLSLLNLCRSILMARTRTPEFKSKRLALQGDIRLSQAQTLSLTSPNRQ